MAEITHLVAYHFFSFPPCGIRAPHARILTLKNAPLHFALYLYQLSIDQIFVTLS